MRERKKDKLFFIEGRRENDFLFAYLSPFVFFNSIHRSLINGFFSLSLFFPLLIFLSCTSFSIQLKEKLYHDQALKSRRECEVKNPIVFFSPSLSLSLSLFLYRCGYSGITRQEREREKNVIIHRQIL